MKKIITIIFIAAGILLSISGCGGKKTAKTEASCYELAMAMAYTDENRENLVICSSNNNEYENMLGTLYGLSMPDDGCIIYSKNEDAVSYAVLQVNQDNADTNIENVKSAFEEYIEKRIATYTGYYPEAVDMLQKSKIFTIGEYVVLDISSNPNEAKKSFEKVFDLKGNELRTYVDNYAEVEEVLEKNRKDILFAFNDLDNDENAAGERELTDIDDTVYYNSNIVKAYLENKPELLKDEKDIFILNRVKEIISECIDTNMTDLEKEKAIHDYMCINMDYDRQGLNAVMEHMENSDNPYGMLSAGFGICTGYASTFKLFMDCLDIDCMIVEGMVYDYTDNHAWNKVKLGATWYNVDVTWDDPIDSSMPEEDTSKREWKPNYTFFNCSDAVLMERDHLWNKSEYPESYETLNKIP